MSKAFDDAFERLIGHEGGFTRDPNDRGNWTGGRVGVGLLKGTKYGISAMTYPSLDIENLTLRQAQEIYYRDFWAAAGCELVHDVMKDDLFDTAVNSGQATARKILQRALGVVDDGVIGPKTTLAISNANIYQLLARFHGWRLDYINDNPEQWARYGRGWSQRIAEYLKAA